MIVIAIRSKHYYKRQLKKQVSTRFIIITPYRKNIPLIIHHHPPQMINSQTTPTSPLQGKQKFDKILISTPLQQTHHTNISFKDAQHTLMTQLQKLVQSSFYTHFDVYFGAENLSNRSYIQQKYKRQQQILKLQIEQTKKKIFQLSRTSDQQEFDRVMKNYLKNMKIINDRKEDVDHVDFIPVIYVKGNKKRPFYGHLMQEFNRKGAGVLKVKVGYRSPFMKLDCFEVNLQTPLANMRRKYFNLDLMWKNTHDTYGNIFTRLSHGNEATFKDIDEKSYSLNLGVDRPQHGLRLQWQNKLRQPSIHQRYDQFIKRNYHLPSFKSSLKLTKVWKDSIEFNDVNMGEYLETKGEVTLPFLSKAQFGKVEVNYRRFFDCMGWRKYFDNQLVRKVLYGTSFQTNMRFNIMQPFSTKYVSDVNENMQLRGFQQPRVPTLSYSNLKLSGKLNFHNYPWIGQARITPFLFGQAGFSLLDMSNNKGERRRVTPTNPTQVYGAGSVGIGVAYYVNKYAQIELVYNLLGYQNLPRLETAGFQIRIGVFD